MLLKQLSLINFKNYPEFEAKFSEKINCFVGNNGVGKTNLLDAIHYLSFCKSYFNVPDNHNIRHNEGFFALQGIFSRKGEEAEVYCSLKRGQKKIFRKNKKDYERLSEHIGQFPLVMISPGDSELINGSSEGRRRFLDGIISQYSKAYLEQLIAYIQVLKQRNALLRHYYDNHCFDSETLEVLDEQLVFYGKSMLQARHHFLEQFISLFNWYYNFLTNSKEHVALRYINSVGEMDFKPALLASLTKDRVLQYTTLGPHKDDLEFTLGGFSLKKYASQGQQKSYLLALKLAQFEFIKLQKNIRPLLLLDDVYDKLDEERFTRLLEIVSGEKFGQVFITDTHPNRMHELLNLKQTEHRMFFVENSFVKQF